MAEGRRRRCERDNAARKCLTYSIPFHATQGRMERNGTEPPARVLIALSYPIYPRFKNQPTNPKSSLLSQSRTPHTAHIPRTRTLTLRGL